VTTNERNDIRDMKWSFEISETSNGAYRCVGTRCTDNVVSIHGGEDEIFRVYKEAYELEANLGTLPSQALYIIVSGAKKAWRSEYHDESFGSWMVEDQNEKNSYVYDGRDFHLMIYKAKENPVWQGFVKEQDNAEDPIFELLCQ
jgi:hypothetical protein